MLAPPAAPTRRPLAPAAFGFAVVALVSATACGAPDSAPRPSSSAARRDASRSAQVSAALEPTAASSGDAAASAQPAVAAPPPRVELARARELLPASPSCEGSDDPRATLRCLVGAQFGADDAARELAFSLFDGSGDVVATERPFTMAGGFRGDVKIVGELPVGSHARHLRWVEGAKRSMAKLDAALRERATTPVRYRHGAILWKFARSVGRTTPSAYAGGWEIGYNVSGSLHASEAAVRDTIVHEIFHLNDQEHRDWSRRELGAIVDGIVARCGAKTSCLAPYAPWKTMVRGGTYYAFQPDNGDVAHEYAAELATRYFHEQLAALEGRTLPIPPFRCGAEENAKAMRALADEFFGGVDLAPACVVAAPR